MLRNQDTTQRFHFSRRAALLGIVNLACAAGLGTRLYYLQIAQGRDYRGLAERNRVNYRLLPPARGLILDRHGVPIAVNKQSYTLVVIPEDTPDLDILLSRLDALIDLNPNHIASIRKTFRLAHPFIPVSLRANLTWEELLRIETNTYRLPGAQIETTQIRHYPNGPATTHVTGYVAKASGDIKNDRLLLLPNFRIGKAGIEKRYDSVLRGGAGSRKVEVNAGGRIIRELERKASRPGQAVTLTIDAEIQRYTFERLSSHRRAAAVLLDIHNGDILAMTSIPGYDANLFSAGIDPKVWKELQRHPDRPLNNNAISGQYAPGSTFKTVVMLAALENGINPHASTFCGGHIRLGNRRFHCWKKHGHGHLAMIPGLRESCDVYFYALARKVGIDAIEEMAHRLGFGAPLGIDLPGEKRGLVPGRAWKQSRLKERWYESETIMTAIGQSYVLATPLQLAVMTARVVNGGFAITPRLRVHDGETGANTHASPANLGISESSRALAMEALDQVTNHPKGTAYRSRIKIPDHAMAGKTGTTQVFRITQAQRDAGNFRNEDLPWKYRDHSLFVGYAPVHAPRYAVSVVVEHGGSGSKVAAPAARDILAMMQKLDGNRSALERMHKDLDVIPASGRGSHGA